MTTKIPLNEMILDAALSLRAVRWTDLNTITQAIYDICEAEGDTSVAVTAEDLENEWKYAGFNPEQDAFVVETSDGRVAGYAALFDINEHCELNGDIYIHPQFKGAGVGIAMLQALEERAQAHVQLADPDKRVFIRIALDNKDETGKAICAHAGFSAVRYHWRMGIELTATPPTPVLPGKFEVRPFVKEQDAMAVWEARNEAFAGNWGSHKLTFEEFSYYSFDNPEYDPTLWQVVWDGTEVAGFSINHYRIGIGWIQTLGVRPAWRKYGLGLALLQLSFGTFYQRGTKEIGLGVDAANATGATRLYLKAGMQTVSEFVTLEKELRAG